MPPLKSESEGEIGNRSRFPRIRIGIETNVESDGPHGECIPGSEPDGFSELGGGNIYPLWRKASGIKKESPPEFVPNREVCFKI
jgi:hypothetical protein